MSTDTLPWFAQADIDSPWRRLHWTLPLALLVCAIVFVWFAYSMERPAVRTPEPAPVSAELIELPASSQSPSRQNTPVQQEQPSENPEPISSTPPPATPVATSPPPAMIENRGAQTINQPLPVIPDELREDAMKETATARFYIAADGSTTVELVKPTQNPRLNRLLLDSLKHWKFNPAMKDGKPVASVETMVVRVQVR